METFTSGVISGIVGGLLTAAILFVSGIVVNRWLLPLIRDFRYRGFRVGGEWKWEQQLNGSDADVVILALRQRAEEVSGVMSTIWLRGGKSTTTMHDFKGYIMDGCLLGTCSPTANSTVSHLSVFATVADMTDGPRLQFRKTAIDYSSRAISHHEYELKKTA